MNVMVVSNSFGQERTIKKVIYNIFFLNHIVYQSFWIRDKYLFEILINILYEIKDKIGWSGVLLLGQHETVSKITQIRENMYRVSQYNEKFYSRCQSL